METVTYKILRVWNGFKAVYTVKYDGEHGKLILYTKPSTAVYALKNDAKNHAERQIKCFNEMGCIPLDAA